MDTRIRSALSRLVLRRRPGLVVSGGRVSCPRRGDIDVDTCYSCSLLDRSVVDGTGTEQIVCAAIAPTHRDATPV